MAFVQVDVVLRRSNVDAGDMREVIAPLEYQERANLLQFFLNRPCGHRPSHPLLGIGRVHAIACGGDSGALAAFMVGLLLLGLVLLGLRLILNENRRAVRIGLDEH